MERAVKLSYTAEKKLEHLFDILVEKWSIKVKNDFIKKLDKCIGIIKVFPYSFPESEKEKGLRKCVITKQTTLYYRFDSTTINVVTIFDNRQNPANLEDDL